MDQKITAYLNSLVAEVFSSPQFAQIPQEQKSAWVEKINNYLNGVVIDTVIDSLTPEQINVIKDLPPDSQEMEDKIEEFASTQPLLAQDLEKQLNQAVANIKQNPQLLS
ncbi:hypothetical protein A3C26_02310 [Candidatus Daviesbacteria bacterium RIFCSPHIGHO2_02_FULL_39_12]|uniref:Uncharacterized protein n=2 Tax=Candidatus Daviesiibacteriota TaxID=1752718 RepID=A0A1F5JA63_9BACT|nr:MAG: hypothetical protein A3C26_02310 [Candidatus Daviesbacteria bacterium RIFCSPHIGHO2_02_FULL_39_12]OGE71690.1 MAG: hypothetical protein A3H40_01620 [Candidatus Daviesbacteria bacterium RIFCSPLOWO2_02_FULL_38_15]